MKTRLPNDVSVTEILISLSIVGVIAAIFFPILAQPGNLAAPKSSESNLSILAKGVLQYVQDNDGKFPRAGFDCLGHKSDPTVFAEGQQNQCGGDGWQDAVGPYVKDKEVFVAPNDKSKFGPVHWGDWRSKKTKDKKKGDFMTSDGNLSYLLNDLLSHRMPTKTITGTDPSYADAHNYADARHMDSHSDGLRMSDVKTPADCLLLTEGHGGWDKAHVDPKAVVVTDWTGSTDLNNKWHHEYGLTSETFLLTSRAYQDMSLMYGLPFANHGGNVAYTDGHVEFKIFESKSGLPALCRSLPWPKTMDPEQRGAEQDSCRDVDNPVGMGWSTSNWY
jgi:prepilin-type processing-associated H-X9-DG protein